MVVRVIHRLNSHLFGIKLKNIQYYTLSEEAKASFHPILFSLAHLGTLLMEKHSLSTSLR